LGDFNYAELNWDNTMEDTNYRRQLSNTKCHTTNKRKQLDLVGNVSIINVLSTSDHNMIICDVHMAAYNNRTSSKKLDINNEDYVSITEILCNTDWDSLFKTRSKNC